MSSVKQLSSFICPRHCWAKFVGEFLMREPVVHTCRLLRVPRAESLEDVALTYTLLKLLRLKPGPQYNTSVLD